jgi:hypothetical protein
MSLNVAKANLIDALKTLRIRWDKAKDSWDDDTRRQFEQDFIAPLESKILAAAKGLDHVSELIAKAQRECGNDP